eukprot:746050-Hanusia_phi.AAC.3
MSVQVDVVDVSGFEQSSSELVEQDGIFLLLPSVCLEHGVIHNTTLALTRSSSRRVPGRFVARTSRWPRQQLS